MGIGESSRSAKAQHSGNNSARPQAQNDFHSSLKQRQAVSTAPLTPQNNPESHFESVREGAEFASVKGTGNRRVSRRNEKRAKARAEKEANTRACAADRPKGLED